MIGRGLCRGPDWQTGQWPLDEGYETLEACSLECDKRPGCTGFDLTPTPDLKNKFRCILHGHDDIQVASATSLQISKCYRMIGRKAIAGAKASSGTPVKAPKASTDSSSSYKNLGAGLCRGPEWQNDIWPKFEGLETIEGCFKECERASGCTAFDVSPSDVKGRFRCVLHGHSNIILADATTLRVSRCFVMQGKPP